VKREPSTKSPNGLGIQLANTWPKITARAVYAMVRNGKELENLDFSSVAATVEKASTYVFAERLIRNAEVRGSTPSAPPIESITHGGPITLAFSIWCFGPPPFTVASAHPPSEEGTRNHRRQVNS